MPPIVRTSKRSSSGPDPLTELRFMVTLPGIEIGRFMECTGISFEYETTQYKEGGNNGYVHTFPGHVKYPNIVLKRGITNEPALLEWALKTRAAPQPVQMMIELIGPDGAAVRAWIFDHAFPIKWTGPNLNASSNQIATETLEVVHHGLPTNSRRA